MDSIDTTAPADLHDFYVDPFPGRKGSERITDTCGKCIGTGLYTAPTHFTDGHGRPICFDCRGTGTRSRLVSSARATARAHAKPAPSTSTQRERSPPAVQSSRQRTPACATSSPRRT